MTCVVIATRHAVKAEQISNLQMANFLHCSIMAATTAVAVARLILVLLMDRLPSGISFPINSIVCHQNNIFL